jgi:hypothetical protein
MHSHTIPQIYRLLKKELLQLLQPVRPPIAASTAPGTAAAASAPAVASKTEAEKKDNSPPAAKAPVIAFVVASVSK